MTSVTRNRSIPEVPDLTLEEKIGQMLCLGWSAPDCLLQMNEQARECIAEMKAGGMIIMSRNVSHNQQPLPPVDSEAVSNMLHEMQSAAEIPLFIATDQEGGRVARFGAAPFTRMPSALTIGQRGDEELAYQAAFVTAQELASVGVNWNFAPTADINSNPANPVIGDRSFGATATVVDPMVRAQVKGYQDGGILACAKHFPGHGDTSQDSHFDLPTLPFGSEIMQERELVPFIGAIQAGVGAIMTAHILFPALDAEFPATLSHPILTGLLREKLGFEGLIVTDCLEMKAIADHWGTARAAVLAAKAGADVLLICHTLARQHETRDALLAAARSGELPEAQIDDSVTRILAAKRRLASVSPPSLSWLQSPERDALRDAFETPANTLPTTLGESVPGV